MNHILVNSHFPDETLDSFAPPLTPSRSTVCQSVPQRRIAYSYIRHPSSWGPAFSGWKPGHQESGQLAVTCFRGRWQQRLRGGCGLLGCGLRRCGLRRLVDAAFVNAASWVHACTHVALGRTVVGYVLKIRAPDSRGSGASFATRYADRSKVPFATIHADLSKVPDSQARSSSMKSCHVCICMCRGKGGEEGTFCHRRR